MSTGPFTVDVLDPENVVLWRFDELRRSGYPTRLAIALAEDESVDLHQACELLERGCPPEQAVAILT